MRKYLSSVRFWAWFFRALLLLNLVPLAIIAFCDHASADDYAFSRYPHEAWEASHSILAFLGGCVRQFHWNYFSWQGCFGAVILGTLDPLAFGTGYYVLVPFLLIGLFVLSSFVFFRTLAFHLRKDHFRAYGDLAACIFCLIGIELVPRALDMFFWWDGAVNYLPFFAFLQLLGAVLIRLYDNRCLPVGLTICGCVLSFLFVSGNYVTALMNLLILLAAGLLLLYRRILLRKGGEKEAGAFRLGLCVPYVGMLLSAITGFLVSVLAPGNAARVEDEGASGITSIPSLVTTSIRLAADSVQDSTTILLVLLLLIPVPFFWQMVSSGEGEERTPALLRIPPWLFGAALFLIYAAGFAPSVYVYGDTGPMRVSDVRFFYYVFFLLLGELYAVARIHRIVKRRDRRDLPQGVTAHFLCGVLAASALFTGIYYLVPRENREVLTSVCAVRSLLIGEAQQYDLEMKERERKLQDPEGRGQDVTVSAVTARPKLLYLSGLELSESPDNWINQTLAAYYDRNSITLVSPDPGDPGTAQE